MTLTDTMDAGAGAEERLEAAAKGAEFRVAIVGRPNCGKTALFNALTGARQKTANYAGVTVERRTGLINIAGTPNSELIDLPGTYGLHPRSKDEEITRDVLEGRMDGEAPPDLVLAIVDSSNLRGHLPFILELKSLGRPLMVVLNMMDMARRDGLAIDAAALSRELGLPVVEAVATRSAGLQSLRERLGETLRAMKRGEVSAPAAAPEPAAEGADHSDLHRQARRLAARVTLQERRSTSITRILDKVVLNPVVGPFLLAAILFAMFQAVYSWAEAPMNWIDASAVWLQGAAASVLPDGPLEGLVVDGIIAGVGSVIIFLPQIIILFTFIILLEQCGYLPRAAFLLDRLMGRVGLSGAAFIPLLSSFACAIPGIMAARTIEDEKDRLTTILVAPLMTCSARLPVYALIIAAFIPPDRVGPGLSLQGLVMFGLYGAGVVSAVLVALILKLTAVKGPRLPLLAELPKYRRPLLRDLALGLWTRAGIFLKRAGTIIFTVTVALWALLNLPFGVEDPKDSVAGFIGQGLAVVLAPIGFDWEISLALVPGMAAREVVVGALGTIYAVGGAGEGGLAATLQAAWSLPTALSFLVWYIFAPQCLSTYAAAKRETNSWLWPTFMFAYLFVLAYGFAAITYWTTLAFVS